MPFSRRIGFFRIPTKCLLLLVVLIVCTVGQAFSLSAFALPLLGPEVAAQPKAAAMSAWHEFKMSHGSNWEVKWNKRTGLPAKLYGSSTRSASGIPSAIATAFLKENRELFGIREDLSDLALHREVESLGGHHFYFNQTHKGVPVFRGEVAVHLDKANRVHQVDSEYCGDIKADVTPAISSEDAVKLAQTAVNLKQGSYRAPKSTLMVYPAGKQFRLAWRVIFNAVEPVGTWQVFVDARDGSILAVENIAKSAVDGTGKVFDPSPVVKLKNNSLSDMDNLDSAVSSQAYSTVSLPQLNDAAGGLYRLTGPFVTMTNLELPNNAPPAIVSPDAFTFTRSQPQFEETMVYFHLDRAQRYIQSLGFTSVNNRSIEVDAHGLNGQDQSHYQPDGNGTGTIAFGDGGVDDGEDAEIILHEYGHAIQDNQVINFGSSLESGSMGEGFSDWFAALMLFPFSDGFQNECVGEWDATSYSFTNPPCLRRLDSTKHYPEDLEGEVHADGELWSATLWEIFLGLGGDMAARDTAMKIVIESHFLLTDTAQFLDGANALIQADQNLNAGANQTLIRNVLETKGFLFEPQLLDYELKTDAPFDFVDISLSGTNTGITQDDRGVQVSIGFDFPFAGGSFNRVIVSSNGYISLSGPGDAWGNAPVPSPSLPNGVIAPFWDDLSPDLNPAQARVYTRVVGVAPNREFIVEWFRMPLYDDPAARLTFEVILSEATGAIKFQYDTMTAGTTTLNRGDSATIGIETADGIAGLAYAFNQAQSVSNGLALEFLPPGASGEGEPEAGAEEGQDVSDEGVGESEDPIAEEVTEPDAEQETQSGDEQQIEESDPDSDNTPETEPDSEESGDVVEHEEPVFEDGETVEQDSPRVEDNLPPDEREDAGTVEEEEGSQDVEREGESEEEPEESSGINIPTPPVLVDPLATLTHGRSASRLLGLLRSARDGGLLNNSATMPLVQHYYKTSAIVVKFLAGTDRIKRIR